MSDNQAPQLYKLEFAPQGVFLILSEKAFASKEVFVEGVLKKLAAKNLEQFDKNAVAGAYKNKTTDPVQIAPAQPKLDEDGSQVLIKVEPPMGRGRKAQINDVMEAVKAAGGEKFYLDLEKIEGMLESFRHRDFVPVGEKRDGTY